jgi:uncharacterized protein with FMN-binding domain
MKKGLKTFLIVIGIIVILGVFSYVGGSRNLNDVSEFVLPDVDMSTLADGNYEGSCDIGRFAMKVTVTIEDHKIVAIAFIDNQRSNVNEDLFGKMNARLLNKENPSFDAITGASITSKAYMIAVTDALSK